MRSIAIAWLIACANIAAGAGNAAKNVEEKNITIIQAEMSADGKTRIAREIVEECIVSLPDTAELEPAVEARSVYVRNVNGKDGDNRHVKTYTARVEIHYLVRQKELIIITSNSVPAQEPVLKEVERTVREVEVVTSDPNDGDIFAAISPRQYYFTTAQGAAENARQRARVWLKNHAGIICPR